MFFGWCNLSRMLWSAARLFVVFIHNTKRRASVLTFLTCANYTTHRIVLIYLVFWHRVNSSMYFFQKICEKSWDMVATFRIGLFVCVMMTNHVLVTIEMGEHRWTSMNTHGVCWESACGQKIPKHVKIKVSLWGMSRNAINMSRCKFCVMRSVQLRCVLCFSCKWG